MRDTIFAQATAAGRAGVAIIRVSGSDAGRLLDCLTLPRPEARRASFRRLCDQDGDMLDQALVLWFPEPNSYTGEDCVELHLHAGPAVIEAVSDTLRRAGARPAEPGEFTQRAFMTGRIDLIEAEGVADLVEAETQAQRRQALSQSTGALSAIYRTWMGRLKSLVALQEAIIDFPDEVETSTDQRISSDVEQLIEEFSSHLADGQRGESLRRGLVFTLVGAPNVGKSSLMNVLVGRDVSIISAQAGTTRDLVEARTILAGVPVTFVDTAGLRDTGDDIEQEGVRRALVSAGQADLTVFVTCGEVRPPLIPTGPSMWVANKIDIVAPAEGAIGISALNGDGIGTLREHLIRTVERLMTGSPLPVLTRSRHRDCLEATCAHLRSASLSAQAELRGEELRLALHHLGRLTGIVGVDDILTEIFSAFCIGK